MKNLGDTMLDFGYHLYLSGDGDWESDQMRLSVVDGDISLNFDMNADQVQRLSDALLEIRLLMFANDYIRCPACGYTWQDATFHGDHRNCRRFPFFPDESGKSHAVEVTTVKPAAHLNCANKDSG